MTSFKCIFKPVYQSNMNAPIEYGAEYSETFTVIHDAELRRKIRDVVKNWQKFCYCYQIFPDGTLKEYDPYQSGTDIYTYPEELIAQKVHTNRVNAVSTIMRSCETSGPYEFLNHKHEIIFSEKTIDLLIKRLEETSEGELFFRHIHKESLVIESAWDNSVITINISCQINNETYIVQILANTTKEMIIRQIKRVFLEGKIESYVLLISKGEIENGS